MLYELRYGLMSRLPRLFVSFVPVVLVLFGHLGLTVKPVQESNSFLDTLLVETARWLYGMPVLFNPKMIGKTYIPTEWLVLRVSYLVLVQGYVNSELDKNRHNVIFYGSYQTWWFYKFVWLVMSTILFYGIFAAGVCAVSVLSWGKNLDAAYSVYDLYAKYSAYEIVVSLLLLFTSSLLIGAFQMALELKASPPVGAVICLGIYFIGLFFPYIILPDQVTMLSRNTVVLIHTIRAAATVCSELFCIVMIYHSGKRILRYGR